MIIFSFYVKMEENLMETQTPTCKPTHVVHIQLDYVHLKQQNPVYSDDYMTSLD